VVVGTIPCAIDEMVTHERMTSGGSYEGDSDDIERNDVEDNEGVEASEVVVENERNDVEDNEVVVVWMTPSPANPSGESSDKKEKTSDKQPIVYQRRQFKNQGEKTELPQPQHADLVPILSSDASPSNSLTSIETNGDLSSSFDHVELSLAQRIAPRVNAGKPPRLGFENDIANFITYCRVSPAYRIFIALLQTIFIPKDWRCAKQDPKWKDAMREEMSAFQKNKT
jgi:hypothetical protein